MTPSFDTWSVVVSLNVARLALTLAMAWSTPLHKTYPGFSHWVAGMGVGVASFFTLALFPVFPGPSVLLANLLNALYVLLLLDGTLRFVLGRPLDRRWYALPLLSAVVGGSLYFGYDSLLARVWWNTVLLGGLATVAGLVWLRNPPGTERRLYLAAALLSFSYTVLLVVRAVVMTMSPPVQSLFQSRPLESIFFLVLGLLDMILLTLYLTLNSERVEADLRASRAEVRMLSGILPMCAKCRKIRDGEGHWADVEDYVRRHTDAEFSHGVCPTCFEILYPDHLDLVHDLE